MHRLTVLGWLWPLVRQLAQVGVLVFAFSVVLDLGIPDYGVFVFSGLLAWSWFSDGVSRASWSVIQGGYLLRHPKFPAHVLPFTAVSIPLIDVLIGLPVLLGIVAVTIDVPWEALLIPPLALIQFGLIAGLGLLVSSASVYVRDLPQLTTVGLLMLFYMTPVFYPLSRVPEEYRAFVQVNPLVGLIDGYRALLIDGEMPDWSALIWPTIAAVLLLAAGVLAFRRLRADFLDRL
jgi:lipopolysaccharide transport system permease protein